ncbi:MAG: RNA 2',3'-cyclic phosphodiesterase [Actinomycetota bacterium]
MRLFLAAEVPEAQKASLAKALQPARLLLPEAKWTGLESWHVTLKFLGEVPEDKVGKVEKLVAEDVEGYQPISSHLTNIGVFPNQRRPRVLWVGLADESSSIMNLGALLEASFAKQGFRKEERLVRPHLTLARFKEPRADPAKVLKTVEGLRGAELDRSEFQISELVLFESQLSPKGAGYQALRRFPLDEP